MAVVITNLFSAIPFVGQDLVEFENIDKSSTLSAYYLEILPIIGQVNSKALNKIKLHSDQQKLEIAQLT